MAIDNLLNESKPLDITLQDGIENEDGSIEFPLDNLAEDTSEDPLVDDFNFYENLAEGMSKEDLREIGTRVCDACESDEESRKDFMGTLSEAMDMTGIELLELNEPYEGACGAVHPLILENAVKFQAKAQKELFPASGPVKTQIIGQVDAEIEQQATRERNHMNYQIVHEMEEYFPDTERMLLHLAIYGTGFKKTYYDEMMDRNVSEFVSLEDLVVPYSAPDLQRATRYTHVIKKTPQEIMEDVANGVYREEDVAYEQMTGSGDISESIDTAMGLDYSNFEEDEVVELLEQHLYLDLGEDDTLSDSNGIALPYIVTVEKNSGCVLRIQRNWKIDDPLKKKRVWFTQYQFVPGFGFYGLGFVHLLGNFQKTLTTVMRSLVDSGQFANMQGGFKARGLRIIGDDAPIAFGEWKEVETHGNDLQKSLMPLPYKEPSAVLYGLLEFLDGRGQKFADTTEQQLADSTNYGPVGTTLALLEASTKFFSAIHRRLHNSQKHEFKLLAELNYEFLDDEVHYELNGREQKVFRTDYDGTVAVIPVSDPDISSNAQRLTHAQTKLQVAQQFPEMHDTREVLKEFYGAMGVEDIDKILPPEEEAQPQDPVSDLMAVTNGKPIKAFPGQDHESHVQVKQLWLEDPMAGKSPLFQNFAGAVVANIREHMMLSYLEKMQGATQEGYAINEAAQIVSQMDHTRAEELGMGDPMMVAAQAEMKDAETRSEELAHKRQKDAAEIALKGMKQALDERKEDNRSGEKQRDTGMKMVQEALKNMQSLAKEDMKPPPNKE